MLSGVVSNIRKWPCCSISNKLARRSKQKSDKCTQTSTDPSFDPRNRTTPGHFKQSEPHHRPTMEEGKSSNHMHPGPIHRAMCDSAPARKTLSSRPKPCASPGPCGVPGWIPRVPGPSKPRASSTCPTTTPDALVILLRIVHLQFADLPDALVVYKQLLQLAVLCDKYGGALDT